MAIHHKDQHHAFYAVSSGLIFLEVPFQNQIFINTWFDNFYFLLFDSMPQYIIFFWCNFSFVSINQVLIVYTNSVTNSNVNARISFFELLWSTFETMGSYVPDDNSLVSIHSPPL